MKVVISEPEKKNPHTKVEASERGQKGHEMG
jgi:hypothetical protein